jgi:hypothetical protein
MGITTRAHGGERRHMAETRKKQGCWRCGCLVIGIPLLILLLLAGYAAAVYFKVPERLGLKQPPAEHLLSSTPDRVAAAEIMDELQAAGVRTEGLSLYVLPVEGRDYNLVVAVLDESQGFKFEGLGGEDVMVEFFKSLALGDASQKHNVGRVAIHYVNNEGVTKVSMTAPTQAIRDYAAGRITRAALLQAIEGKVDLKSMYGEVLP